MGQYPPDGIDLTRRLHQNQVYGATTPLVTKADGTEVREN